MKIKKTIVNNRRNNILKFIKDNKQAKTNELVDIFKVSEITIRRDLDYLNVILTGGRVSYPKNALTGTFALNNLKTVASDISILGISGVSESGELTTSVIDEVEINQYMINESTSKNILVCDSSKFSKTANFKIGTIENIDILITDSSMPRSILEYAESLGIKVILV